MFYFLQNHTFIIAFKLHMSFFLIYFFALDIVLQKNERIINSNFNDTVTLINNLILISELGPQISILFSTHSLITIITESKPFYVSFCNVHFLFLGYTDTNKKLDEKSLDSNKYGNS